MKISTRGRYSLRMMIDLAEHYNDDFIALKDISERQSISKKYLEQIVPFLNRSNLLTTYRGHMGGYKLARHPSKITIGDILLSSEGSLNPVSCMDNDPNVCTRQEDCMTLPIWQGLSEVIADYLNGITLQDILDRRPDSPEYYI
ncbi:RrF2 family transcriptional regulator [Lacrimispora indolis]|uniref:RrF2 family transcriptional regulator n=1 Tax=Lacrimispora indolis TaxID=69825 RepID=UPI0003FB254A|nr:MULTISPECIES: Rrf2 family transcriptional regulator [Lachnospiraceae]MBE7719478.1 Rrf2 family transcriptional regulator [Lacrimispora celerecrescens]